MLLDFEDVVLFYRLHRTLMHEVNRQLEIVPDVHDFEEFIRLPPETMLKVRNAFLDHADIIEPFVKENPAGLSDEELEIVHSWQHGVFGRFFIFRYLKSGTVFISGEDPPTAYGVQALSEPLEDIVGPHLPVYVGALLLPFRDRIIYDGMLNTYNITFGGGYRRSLNESYKESKERMGGLVASLPAQAKRVRERAQRRKPGSNRRRSAKDEVQPILEAIITMTDDFCREYLNEEYALLSRKLAEKLARKRPSPLLRGRHASWASGIVRTIGWVNFLSDPSQTPHMRLRDIDGCFGISESTGAAKLKEIRTMFRIGQLEPDWTLPSMIDQNPLVWMLEINGFAMDVRHAPREVQEIALEKGLIPYIPGDE